MRFVSTLCSLILQSIKFNVFKETVLDTLLLLSYCVINQIGIFLFNPLCQKYFIKYISSPNLYFLHLRRSIHGIEYADGYFHSNQLNLRSGKFEEKPTHGNFVFQN